MPSEPVSLPLYEDEDCNDYREPSPRQVLRIAINLKNLIDNLIPSPIPVSSITEDSIFFSEGVMAAVYGAAGGDGSGKGSSARRYQAPLVFCLLKVAGWYASLGENELSNTELYGVRQVAAENIAAKLIDRELDAKYLFLSLLCHRYSINLNDVDADPENVLELAVDMHSTIIISSGGYQRCIKWLWRGWIVQSSQDPSEYVLFMGIPNTTFSSHFDPDRIKTPLYQNILEIIFSFLYLFVFTIIVNTDTMKHRLSIWEWTYYLATIGFSLDEVTKFSHIGVNYLQFSNAFNDCMYATVLFSMVIRLCGISTANPDKNVNFNIMSYRILSMAAPFMWARMLLFLDVYQFVGTMIIIIKKMMKESIIFFVLLAFILIGFLQAFLGLDQADGKRDLTKFIIQCLLRTVLSGPDFDSISRFAYPYGSILYYSFTFIVVLILLNVLIALYSQAYSDVVENATDEYLAQYSSKILKYVRAPDAKIFCPPLNLIEIFLLDIPFSWWISKEYYIGMCDHVMLILYFPMLIFIANYESRVAKRVSYNRQIHAADDANELDTEWDLSDGFDSEGNPHQHVNKAQRLQERAEQEEPSFTKNFSSWSTYVDELKPPITESRNVGIPWQYYKLYDKVDKLTVLLKEIIQDNQELKKHLSNTSEE